MLLIIAVPVLVGTVLNVRHFRDVGYPDSAILLTVREYAQSGRIYTELDRPPYMVTVYGPLTYSVLSIPYRLAEAAGFRVDLAVRVAVVLTFALCLFLVFLISRRLSHSSMDGTLSVLFALAVLPLADWTTQIRGDFLALTWCLLGVFLILRSTGALQTVLAACCAAVGLLVKQTFIAAPIAIVLWLFVTRRTKEAMLSVTAMILLVAGGYAFVAWREPLMLQHVQALKPPVLEYRGALAIVWRALSQPVLVFAVVGALIALKNAGRERLLILILWVVSWLVPMVTVLQVGANINYFWEPLFISAVLAGPALRELDGRLARTPTLVMAALVLLIVHSSLPTIKDSADYLQQSYRQLMTYPDRRAKWQSFVRVAAGRRLLSTLPSLTFYSSSPEVPDPFLNTFLERRGWNPAPVVNAIKSRRYELIVVMKDQISQASLHRGVRVWPEHIWKAVAENYKQACVYDNLEVWLPPVGSEEILDRLVAAGCEVTDSAGRQGR
jgi:Dolichyl-phosphate-mannose-protein mannosyltransferase